MKLLFVIGILLIIFGFLGIKFKTETPDMIFKMRMGKCLPAFYVYMWVMILFGILFEIISALWWAIT